MYDQEQDDMPNMFDSPEQISKHLLDVNDYASNAINHDSARANLNFNELRGARAEGALLLELEEAEKLCGWNLETQKNKSFGSLGVLNVTSRGKNGWASVLAKTDKHVNIQTAEQYAGEIDAEFNDDVAENLGDKVQKKIPFLKKREL